MAVTVYLFDPLKVVRRILSSSVTQLIHHEHDYTITAEIPAETLVMPGEYLGFRAVDGRFRLFSVDSAQYDDAAGTVEVSATDAAAADLANIVVEDKLKEGVTAKEAATLLLEGTGWSLGAVTSSGTMADVNAYYTSLWEALLALQEPYGVRVAPYYVFDAGRITGQKVDVTEDAPVFRGRIFEPETDASDIYITYSSEPVTVLYGVGDEMDTETGSRLTLADAVWSTANGDPANKPAGQTWIEDAKAVAKYGRRARTFIAQDVTDVGTLITMTWEELQRVKSPSVNASATITDVEMVPGMSHKAVRMGDLIYIRPRKAADIETRIIKIDRDYIYPDLTKLESGDELATLTSQVTSLIRSSIKTKETLTVYRNKFHADENLIQLNAKAIQLNAEDILTQSETLRLHAGVLDEHDELLVTAMIELDGQEQRITQMAGTIDEQGNLLSGALIELDGLNAEIELMVTKDGVISAINLSPESIVISSEKINLVGYVTTTMLETEVIDVVNTGYFERISCWGIFAEEQIDTYYLSGSECSFSNVEIDATPVNAMEKYVCTGGFGVSAIGKTTINYLDHSGNPKSTAVVIDVERYQLPTTNLLYWGYTE